MKTSTHYFRAAFLSSALMASACSVPRVVAATESTSTSVAPPIREVAFQTLGLGERSGCTRAAKMLVTNEKEWRRVWAIHSAHSKAAAPHVDWSHQAVVVLLGGQGGSIQINQIVRAPDAVVVFFDNPVLRENLKSASATRSFHFALIEKPQLPLRFQDLSNPECATCVLKPGE